MTHPRARRLRRAAVVVCIALALFCLEFWRSTDLLTTTTYEAKSAKLTAEVTAVLLTDVHDHAFGAGSERLIAEVAALAPDLILFAGDGLNGYSASHAQLCALVERLCDIAPVYFAMGNHELRYVYLSRSAALFDDLRAAGAVVLDRAYADVTVNGQKLRIGGLFDYLYNEDRSADWYQSATAQWLYRFESTDAYKLLLVHQPDFVLDKALADDPDARWAIDLTLCGHEHGGQVRIPFVGGFYSTHLGLFSPYLDGAHLINGIPTVISRGLGTYGPIHPGGVIPPRLFNPPELVVLRLAPGA